MAYSVGFSAALNTSKLCWQSFCGGSPSRGNRAVIAFVVVVVVVISRPIVYGGVDSEVAELGQLGPVIGNAMYMLDD